MTTDARKVCDQCSKVTKGLTCGACQVANYCSRECQLAAWRQGHKVRCKELQATARAANAAQAAATKKVPEADEVAPVPDKVLYPYDKFLSFFKTKDTCNRPPTGLANCGNTCFANALLQCLLHTPPLAAFLLSGDHTYSCSKPSPSAWCLLCELQALAEQIQQGAHAVVSPRRIVKHVRKISPHLSPGRQEDSHDLYLAMLEAMEAMLLHEAGGKAAHPHMRTRETTLMGHIFGGYVRFQTICPECGHISQRFDTKADLELEVSARAGGSVEGALRALFADEQLDQDNQYKCEKCRQEVCALRRTRLEVAPNTLALCLKRFGVGRFGKNNRHLAYGRELCLDEFMGHREDTLDQVEADYTLYGVIVHLDYGGSTMFGHYISYVRVRDGRWFRCDDSSVVQVDEEEALSQKAYMLFYLRNAPHAAPDPAHRRPLTSSTPAKPVPDSNGNHAASWAAGGEEGTLPTAPASSLRSKGTRAAPEKHANASVHANGELRPHSLGSAGSSRSEEAGGEGLQGCVGSNGSGTLFAGVQVTEPDQALPSPSWRLAQIPEAGSTGGGGALVVKVDLPGVQGMGDIRVCVRGREVLVHVVHQYMLMLTVPESQAGLGDSQGPAAAPGDSGAALVPCNVVFKGKSGTLKLVLQTSHVVEEFDSHAAPGRNHHPHAAAGPVGPHGAVCEGVSEPAMPVSVEQVTLDSKPPVKKASSKKKGKK